MLRAAVMLSTLAGCQLVFGVDVGEVPAICGPYDEPTPVVFDPRLDEVRELSVGPSGMHGMVYATYAGGTAKNTRPHAVMLVNGTWVPDDTRNRGLDVLYGAVMTDTDVAFGWIDQSTMSPPQLFEYRYVPTVPIWSPQIDIIDNDTTTNKHAGNLITIGSGATAIRLLVETIIPLTGERKTLQIRAQVGGTWGPTDRLKALSLAGNEIDPSSGVLTANGDRLVYSAVVGDDDVPHLYASEVEDNNTSFLPGERLQIPGNSASARVTEPWINADCTQIWFKRDGVIYTATQRLDENGSGQ